MKLKVLDLFSGIGGFSLGLEKTGSFETIAFCEIEEYPRKVLKKHWPGVPIYEDVRNVTRERLEADGIIADVVTGGFPCQDISVAGKQKGIEGERSGLWGELCRIIGDIRPRYAIVENVTALISGERGRWFQRVLGDLAEIGYDCEWHCISASELGAHHHRDRVWIICHPSQLQRDGSDDNGENRGCEVSELRNASGEDDMADTNTSRCETGDDEIRRETGANIDRRCERSNVADSDCINVEGGKDIRSTRIIGPRLVEQSTRRNTNSGGIWHIEPDVGRVANGIPRRVDRLKGLGNAVVPQIPELIGRAILETINEPS